MEFCLRPFTMDDVHSIAKYANDQGVAANLRDAFPHPYSVDDARAFVASISEEGCILRAIAVGGEAVGSVGVFAQKDVYAKSAELGYWLGRPFWGKGVMTAAVSQICRLAFERLDVVRIYAEPYAPNTGSRRVLEKAGFTLEGVLKNSVYKNGELMDSCIYALLRD